ncbi:hypothetical protein NHX12_014754 [Muraenolepis orangiensis]|uniref:Uncharacterized protein n=1 Tax=Muraenolepis orangiensis TaxID=630683 RepID=A0A9Q0D943_9TELE|nr:hypothetical protein NHX12_014754 [Muraenolepis orangiensis]
MWITSTPQLCSMQTPRPGELKVQDQNSHEGTATTSTAVPATPVCTTVPVAAAHESGECSPKSEGRRMAALREIWQRVPVTWRAHAAWRAVGIVTAERPGNMS